MKHFTRRRQVPNLNASNAEFFSKIPSSKKISYEQVNLCKAKISLDEIIKSINSQTYESPSNDGLTTEFYKQFSDEQAPVLLDVYDLWGKLGNMGVTNLNRNHVCHI